MTDKFRKVDQSRYKQETSLFPNIISKDGPFPPEKGRYILYVGLPCPFAARALYVRSLKGLEDVIDVAILHSQMDPSHGWTFDTTTKEATGDPIYGKKYLSEIYHQSDPAYDSRITVPVLFDKKQGKVVNNESSEILRIINSAFDELIPSDDPRRKLDFYPEKYRKQIDELNDWIFNMISIGVYKAGFARQQEQYDAAVQEVFAGLDKLESILADGRRYLIPEAGITEVDIRLMPSLIRFDVAYVTLFKCNIRTIRADYPHIHRYMRQIYWSTPEIQKWTNFDHIKNGYASNPKIVSNELIPAGPLPPILPL